ncbi:YoaK family protein [Sphingomonas sp. RB1R13]|uniref:YoaK family protein n=1 Tax=Sphingomonas sp. RB1R13 TaxID=3096159 RepID=UPI002FC7224E
MTSLDTRSRLLAAALSALAGFVDAIGFLGTGGFFVSFMSGNSTRLAVGVARNAAFAATALALVAAFVAGVMIAALIGQRAGPRRAPVVLLLVTALLALAAILAPLAPPLATFAVVAVAMGAINMILDGALDGKGDVRLGVTYMTGTLVRIGQRLATALSGGDRWAWAPFLLLWLGLVAGAITGALTFGWLGLGTLWIATGAAALMTLIVLRHPLTAPETR